jgi:Ca2+-binding EF-hand superfamily protein
MPAKLPDGSGLIAQLDKNKDGKVTLDEYKAPILARFDAIDTNHDGVLSPADLKAANAVHR